MIYVALHLIFADYGIYAFGIMNMLVHMKNIVERNDWTEAEYAKLIFLIKKNKAKISLNIDCHPSNHI